ncbi:hypothetical protein KFK09_010357 [Dendrobium nobile]|uniref:Myb-like domain-containing protein n=1 Tax=Dendrobium nobile TaxID=94219 RepID=A0A8T3BLX9_DENNO|nr:hypothetical protein KFK09_010357 [Dendrobium nobile]
MQEEEGPPPSDQLAAPISVRMPPLGLGSSSASAGNGFDEIAVERDSGCGSPAGNRWPRQETMALLKIRSDMDPLFQEATLKAPLWEQVSRKLTEEGYQRSAKKCKEKFENVFKYYKRTKEARAGKTYRFFSQLEALRSSSSSSVAGAPPLPPTIANSSATMVNIEASSSGAAAPSPHTLLSVTVRPPPPPAAGPITTTTTIPPPPTDAADGPSSSSNTSSYSGTESEDEDGAEASRKRKRERREAPEGSGKMMAFFEGLIKEVMDQQETMLQRFLEAIERREQNRMIREEAWRRQEKSRISRERELAAQERAAAASRDDAIISFLQKLTGQKIPIPPPPQPPETTVDPAEETPTSPPPPPRPEDPDQPPKETTLGSSSRRTIEAPILSSRWPKSEVHALINLRSGMESKYLDSIPKGPLWEEISACMGRLGYDRSAKRCKEKWENINKYYKKVKESNKNRPEDAKTCPYFHQLDALYRAKIIGGSSSAGTAGQTLSTDDHQLAIISPTAAVTKQQDDRLSFFEQGSSSASLIKKPEDIVKKKIEQAVVESESKKMETGVSFRFRIQQYIMPGVHSGGTGQNNLSAMVR